MRPIQIGNLDVHPVRSGLIKTIKRRFLKSWLAPLAVLSLLLVLAACGGNAVDTANNDSSGPAPAAAASVEVGNITSEPGAVATESSGLIGVPESAQALVAAQESVMGGIYRKALPSVVHIRVTSDLEDLQTSPLIPDDFFGRGEGSGFVWDDAGHIVTNQHVIAGADTVTVIFADRSQVTAKVLGGDPHSDLAVLKLESQVGNTTPVDLGDSSQVQVGQLAVAIGAPFGQEFTMTSGIVSAIGRTIQSSNSSFTVPEVIQTDAPINPGNSGGPLFDRLGRVVGINTQIISRSGSNAGVGLAIPINIAQQVIPALIDDGRYEYAWLGISGVTVDLEILRLMELPQDTRGTLVISIIEDGPADISGLHGSSRTDSVDGIQYSLGGDTIVGINGTSIGDMTDLIVYLNNETRPGDTVTLEVIRDDGEAVELPVELGKRPSGN